MKLMIMFAIFAGVVCYSPTVLNVIDDPNCTWTGKDCPEVPCCLERYGCQYVGLNLDHPNYAEYSSVVKKSWKCLDKVELEKDCNYHEECSHLGNAACINLKCQNLHH